jgi:hypothetical protein
LKHITTTAFSENHSHERTVRLDQPNFKYTTFPLKGYTILPTRNIASNFVRSDASYVRGHKAGDAAICPKVRREDPCVLVSHSIFLFYHIRKRRSGTIQSSSILAHVTYESDWRLKRILSPSRMYWHAVYEPQATKRRTHTPRTTMLYGRCATNSTGE